MTDEQRQELIRLLQQGEDIAPEWARVLFLPEKREYELVYHGKEREEDILANTLAVPLQPVRTFGKNDESWHNMLVFGDNLQVMKSLLELKKSGQLCNADGTPGVRLVYIDPPFATRQEFSGTQDQRAYQDKIAGSQFVEFLRRRLVLMRELLASNGAIYVHLDQRKSHTMKLVLDEVFGNTASSTNWCGGVSAPTTMQTSMVRFTTPFSSTLRLAIMCGTHSSVRYPKNTWASSLIKSIRRMDAVMHGGT
jgi:DNA methylase